MKLKLTGVDVALGGRAILDDVNLVVEPGEILGLVGPNGAGKTTLLRTALGLIRPASGTVEVLGTHAKKVRQRLGYVPQKHDVDWDFPITILEMVVQGRTPHLGIMRRIKPADVRAASRALAQVGLSDLPTRPIAELSGGQRQRVLIARALSLEPEVLLLDEPFTGVDALTQEILINLLRDLAAKGVAIIMTTHDLPQALENCTRIAVVSGTVLVVDTPDKVAHHPAIEDVFGAATARRLAILADAELAPSSPELSALATSERHTITLADGEAPASTSEDFVVTS